MEKIVANKTAFQQAPGNGNEITSATMHLSFRSLLFDLPDKKIGTKILKWLAIPSTFVPIFFIGQIEQIRPKSVRLLRNGV